METIANTLDKDVQSEEQLQQPHIDTSTEAECVHQCPITYQYSSHRVRALE